MEKNKSVFTKIWLGCFVLLFSLCAYGMSYQVKETYSANKLYGLYMWTNIISPIQSDKMNGSYNMNFTTNHTASSERVVVGYILKDGSYIARDDAVDSNGQLKIINYKPHDRYGREIIAYQYYDHVEVKTNNPKSMSGMKYKEETGWGLKKTPMGGNENVFWRDASLWYLNGASKSYIMGGNTFGVSNFNDSIGFNPVILNFGEGTTISSVCEDRLFGAYEVCSDAGKFTEWLKNNLTPVAACYWNGSTLEWTFGNTSGMTLANNLYSNELCARGIPITLEFPSDKDPWIECPTSYSPNVLGCTTNVNDYKITLYVNPGTYKLTDLGYRSGDGWDRGSQKQVFDYWTKKSDGSKVEQITVSAKADDDDHQYVAKIKTLTQKQAKFVISCMDEKGEHPMYGHTFYSNTYDKVSKPKDPVIEGYIFTGWNKGYNNPFDFNTSITDDITLYATCKRDPNMAQVVFHNGIVVESAAYGRYDPPIYKIIYVPLGEKIPVPTDHPVPKDGVNKFLGWVKYDKSPYDFNVPVTGKGNVTVDIYSIFGLQYEIQFDSNGGSPVATQYVTAGNLIKKPVDPVKSERNFVCWLWEGDCYDFGKAPESDMLLTAYWVEDEPTYTIRYNANGGSYAPSEYTYLESGEGYITLEYPRYVGHQFVYWSTSKDCSKGTTYERGTGGNGEIKSKNLTLYACWEPEPVEERCGLRNNPETGDGKLILLILLEIISIGSLIAYFVMKNRKNSNVTK